MVDGAVRDQAVEPAVGVAVGGEERLLPRLGGELPLPGGHFPPRLGTVDRAGRPGAHPVVQAGADLADLLRRHQVHPAAVGGAGVPVVHRGPREVDLQIGDPGRRAEAVPPVDRVLGGDQDRHGLAALLGRGQVRRHHPRGQAAAAVGRGHRHVGDRAGGQRRAARHGQLARHAAEGGDAAAPVEGTPGTVQVVVDPPLGGFPLRDRGGQVEAGVDGAHPVGDVGFVQRADLWVHPRHAMCRSGGPASHLPRPLPGAVPPRGRPSTTGAGAPTPRAAHPGRSTGARGTAHATGHPPVVRERPQHTGPAAPAKPTVAGRAVPRAPNGSP